MEKNQKEDLQQLIMKFDWSSVDSSEKAELHLSLSEFQELSKNNLEISAEYRARISALLISMFMTIIMHYLKCSINLIIVSIFLFQMIVSAITGFSKWGSNVLVNNSKKKLEKVFDDFTKKYSTEEFKIDVDKAET